MDDASLEVGASAQLTDGESYSGNGSADKTVAIIGGGPAGLTAAYMLQRDSDAHKPIVFEASDLVGGISRTESHNGYRFDIGGHRFFTKVTEVEQLWHDICGDELITRPRSSRIYYRGKFYNYPLKIFNALFNIGPFEAVRIMLSYIRWKIWPHKEEENLEQWVTNRFGKRLFKHFFETYTEKVWGLKCTEIRADWAAQRIKNLSLTKAVWNALTGANDTASLIEEFEYPRLGPGQMWEMCSEQVVEAGGDVHMKSYVKTIHLDGNRVTGLDVETEKDGKVTSHHQTADFFVNSMPINEMVEAFSPAPPKEVVEAARGLKYRDFLIVTLVLDHADPFPDNWIYIHSPEVQVGRIQNFRTWSEHMLPNKNTASIGMEFFCHEGDGLWEMSNEDLIELAGKELEQLGLADQKTVIDGFVIRQKKAYPVYDGEYQDNLDIIKDWLLTLENFQTVGRAGMHRYNNQDHSMLTAMLAARNILGEDHDLWSVNVERSYHEEFEVDKEKTAVAAE